jgi:hypothetical protein
MDDLMRAETQYNDLIGQMAADGWDGTPLHDFAKEAGIDMSGRFPVCLRMERTDGEDGETVSIGFVNGEDYNAIKRDVLTAQHVRIEFVETKKTADDFFKMCKRFSLILESDLLRKLKAICAEAESL